MSKMFLVNDETVHTYEDLLADVNHKVSYHSLLYIKGNEPYSIFLKMIHSLVYDYPIEIVDGDFSEAELEGLGITTDQLTLTRKVNEQIRCGTVDELIDRIEDVSNWRMTLYTSGTTGRPKKVTHTFETLTRNVKRHAKFKGNVWAYAFNPTHMAGLQVFFQAFLNKNSIVYLFGKRLDQLPKFMNQYHITNLSATATFYRNLIPYLKRHKYPSVKRVTFGGESYDASLEQRIHLIFPNATIKNIYASTEAGSLFTAHGDVFEIREELKEFIKITDKNELLIHQALLGESSSLVLENEWFYTGDLVEVIDETHFTFISRQSEMINIGGYKVNPLEVEQMLSEVPGVLDIVVKGRKNSVTGEILVADVVKKKDIEGVALKKAIKQFATAHLQQWKVPRIIKFVDEIPMTRTGKKVRT